MWNMAHGRWHATKPSLAFLINNFKHRHISHSVCTLYSVHCTECDGTLSRGCYRWCWSWAHIFFWTPTNNECSHYLFHFTFGSQPTHNVTGQVYNVRECIHIHMLMLVLFKTMRLIKMLLRTQTKKLEWAGEKEWRREKKNGM